MRTKTKSNAILIISTLTLAPKGCSWQLKTRVHARWSALLNSGSRCVPKQGVTSSFFPRQLSEIPIRRCTAFVPMHHHVTPRPEQCAVISGNGSSTEVFLRSVNVTLGSNLIPACPHASVSFLCVILIFSERIVSCQIRWKIFRWVLRVLEEVEVEI